MTNFDESGVTRRRAGTAGGGQFTHGDERRSDAGQVLLMDDEELAATTRELGRRKAIGNPKLDADDLGQEIALEMLVARRSKMSQVEQGKQVTYKERAYVNRVASQMTSIAVAETRNAYTRQALHQLRQREDAWYQEHGRRMPLAERARVAAEIREAQKPRMRAAIGYENEPRMVNMMSTSEDGRQAIAPEVEFASINSPSMGEDSEVADYVEALPKQADRREVLWTALSAERDGLPRISEGRLPVQVARRNRSKVVAAGGVATVLGRWRDGDLPDDDPAVRSAFAPFGNASARECDEFADLVSKHPAYADDIWSHCLDKSTRED